eukprot:1177728-Prorocentrum_minimum.AAC.1
MPTGPFVRCPERLHRPPAFLRCRPLPLHRRRQLLLVHAAEVLHGVLVLLQDRAKLRPHALHLRRTSVAQASHKCHTHGRRPSPPWPCSPPPPPPPSLKQPCVRGRPSRSRPRTCAPAPLRRHAAAAPPPPPACPPAPAPPGEKRGARLGVQTEEAQGKYVSAHYPRVDAAPWIYETDESTRAQGPHLQLRPALRSLRLRRRRGAFERRHLRLRRRRGAPQRRHLRLRLRRPPAVRLQLAIRLRHVSL